MDNGLEGRYLSQLEGWNRARAMAVEILDAYADASKSIEGVVKRWHGELTHHLNELKRTLSNVLFMDSQNTIDELARVVMRADGWWRAPQ